MTLFEIIVLLGALGFFIYGMKIMSEGIQKAAGQNLRKILGIMTRNRFTGVLTGFSVTSIIQSSSATTVMVVSFVNAGLLNLRQAIGVIMGANIGTTMTAVLVTVLGFSKFSLGTYALPVIALGFPLLFAKRDTLRSMGEFIIGFALLFMGLDALKNAVPEFSAESMQFLNSIKDLGALSTLIFILIGTLLTVIIQSSSAAVALTLVLCDKGYIDFSMAAAIVLGENIGTTITANLAALIGNVNAKRAAVAHSLFNIIGVIWMFFIFSPFLRGIEWSMVSLGGLRSPFESNDSIKWGLTLFHILFNICNTLLLVWFVSAIEKLTIRIVRSKKDEDEQHHLEYISSGMLQTPELSIIEVKKEVIKFGKITKKMMGFINQILLESDNKKQDELFERVAKYEEITDKIELEVAEFLRKISEGEVSRETSIKIRIMLNVIDDLETIGDIIYQISKQLQRKKEERIYFLTDQRNNILNLLNVVDEGFDIMNANLEKEYDQVKYDTALIIEEKINELRNSLREKHYMHVEAGEYGVRSGIFYSEILSMTEKIGDHVTNVTESITGKPI